MRRPLLLAMLLLAPSCAPAEPEAPATPSPTADGPAEPAAGAQASEEELIVVPDEVVLPTTEPEPPTAEPVAAGEVAEAEIEDERPIGRVSISGPLDHSRYDDDGRLLMRLIAEDSRTASEGLLELTGVRLELADHGVVLAETGRVLFESTGGRLVLGGPQDRIELEVTRVELDAGHALAPMTLTSGAMVASLEEQRLDLTPGQAGQRPLLDGARLQLDADAIVVELEAETLTTDGATRLVLRDEEGAPARSLDAETLTLSEPEPGRLELDARGAPTRLVVHGEPDEDLTLTAPRLVLGALRVGEEELVLSSLVVHGTGQVERAGGVAVGEDLDFVFAPDGEAGRVVLHGEPVLRFVDPDDGTELTLEADGPLGLTLAGELAFDTTSRAVASWGTWQLVADGGLDGIADEASGRIDLHGVGGVTLAGDLGEVSDETGSLSYRTEEVRLTHRTAVDPLTGEALADPGPDWPKVHLVGTGLTEVDAAGAEDLHAVVVCTDGMELDLAGERWTLPAGRGVTLRLETQGDTYTAEADELLGLDPESLRFEATGEVSFEQLADGLRRSGRGGRVRLSGEDNLELVGSEDVLARYEEGGSWVEARSLERLGRRVTAGGRVTTHLELELMAIDLTCGRLELSGLDAEARELDSLEKLELGRGVSGTVVLDGQRLELDAASLVLLRVDERVALPDDAGPPVLYELFGEGPVSMAWTTADADWRVDCRTIEATVQEAPAGASGEGGALGDAWFELVARGDVRVRDELNGFAGLGETLHLDHGAVDRALLEGGAGPARVEGRLPDVLTEGVVTYRGTVERLALAGGQVEADGIDILLSGLELPGSNLDARDDSTWRVIAERLYAEVGLVELAGGVRFEGTDRGVPMRLLAQLVTFVNADLWIAAQAEPDSQGPGKTRLEPEDLVGTSITAHGEVLLRRGAEYEVAGDELSVAAETRELRLSGNPARAVFAGISSRSRWLRLDPVHMTLDTGPGQISMDPVLMKALEEARRAREATEAGQ